MKIQPKTTQLPPTESKKSFVNRFKESASQTIQKTKDAVVEQGNKLRSALRREHNTSTHHAKEHQAQELVGSESKAFDQRYAQTGGSLQRTNIMNRPSPVLVSDPAQSKVSSEPDSPPDAPSTTPVNGLDPAAIHMNQFDGDPNGSNSDCGPTSMAMALQGVGLTPEGANANASTVDTVQAMRQSMYPDDPAQDGVTVNENGETVRADSEHSQWTTFSALITGAEAAGAEVNQIRPDTGEIAESVQNGNPVVVNGNPGEDGGGWADSYNSGHFITVSGYNAETETFTINDPLDNAPREVSSEELSNYMEGWSWRALEVSNPNASSSPAPVSPLSPQPI
ncbi:MAG: hypothetical protein EP343_08770 [Deltaproteobacteria bacterium]|nr:MAG: hypothetical protein EP343_08770 [Deltaproteobacteria bacterium]